MLCPHSRYIDDQAFFDAFNRKTAEGIVPVNGGLDLTDGCNLQCVHCYVRKDDSCEMLCSEDAFRILEEAAEAGCLFMLLTGGEPMLHPDFASIYRRAKELGLLVTVFTNATLMDEDAVRLFCDFTPLGVEVSIYGATGPTHDAVTGIEGSFGKALAGVKMLKRAGIKVGLKTMVMTLNEFEFGAMVRLADDLEVPFRMDSALFPRLSGENDPVEFRVPVERAVECEFSLPGRIDAWKTYIRKIGKIRSDGSLYICGAGRTSFHVTSKGLLQPCIMTPHIQADLNKLSFAAGWRDVSSAIVGMKASPDNPCLNCVNSLICDACPGFFKLETGDANRKSDYLCKLAEKRASILASAADS